MTGRAMAHAAAIGTAPAGTAAPPGRPGPTLVAAVLALHLAALAGWGTTAPPPRPGPLAAPMTVRLVPVTPPPDGPRTVGGSPGAGRTVVPAPPPVPVPAPAPVHVPAPAPAPDGRLQPGDQAPAGAGLAVQAQAVPVGARAAAGPPVAPSPGLVTLPVALQTATATAAPPGRPRSDLGPGPALDDTADADASTPSAPAAATRPPPVYRARPLPPGQWRFRFQQGGTVADAVLDWQHDGHRFRLRFDATAAGRPLVQQTSEGALGEAGLAPERFVDRRRGRGARAASVDSGAGLVRFSATEATAPAWVATQDRLAWLLQLAAVVDAADSAGQPPPEVLLHVVDARGGSALWRFDAVGDEPVPTPAGPRPARAWRHEPAQPDGLRLEVWLDPAAHHRPLRLRQTLLRTGAVTEWLPAEP